MSVPSPTDPGWYPVARRTERWWDGSRWSEDTMHHGRRTTASAVISATKRMQWLWVGVGIAAWAIFLVLGFTFGTAAIVAAAIIGSRLIAALPPTP